MFSGPDDEEDVVGYFKKLENTWPVTHIKLLSQFLIDDECDTTPELGWHSN